MSEPIRVALYYTPEAADPLAARAAAWLGRDADSNAPRAQPDLPDIAAITADPRSYGFHATLKPPMRLLPGVTWRDVVAATRDIAASVPSFALPPMAVTDLRGFLALCETTPSPSLQALSDVCVAGLDHLRAPPEPDELARRRRHGLRPAQEANLTRWGYPHVFATWFFHMTLTRRLAPEERALYQPAAEAWFADVLTIPRHVSDLCLFTQSSPAAPFTIAERIPLRG